MPRLRTRIVTDRETGLPLIVMQQETSGMLDENAAARADFNAHGARRVPAGIRRVASIPNVIVAQLQASGIWDDKRALLRWLSDPDNRAFRTDDGRRLA